MLLVDQIHAWLRKKTPYSYGVELLIKSNGATRLNKTLLFNATDANLSILVYELEKILLKNGVIFTENEEESQSNEFPEPERTESHTELSNSTESIKKEPAIQFSPRITADHHLDSPVPSLDIVTRLKSELKSYYRERGHYHGALHAAKDDDERYSVAKQLMKVQSNIDKVYGDLEKIEKGTIPKNQILKELSAEQYKRITNLKTYVARYKRMLATEQDAGAKAAHQKKLNDYQSELNTYYNA